MAEITYDWGVLRRAKITQKDFATIIGVSRVSVNNWMHGDTMNPLRSAKVQKALVAIERGITEGDFPMATIKDDELRLQKIKKIIYDQLTPKT